MSSLNDTKKGYAITISILGKKGQAKYANEDVIKYLLKRKWEQIMDQLDPVTSDFIYEKAEKSTKVHLHGIFCTAIKFKYKYLQDLTHQVYCRELRTPEEETNWFYYIHKDENLFEDEQVHTLPTVAIDHGQKETQ